MFIDKKEVSTIHLQAIVFISELNEYIKYCCFFTFSRYEELRLNLIVLVKLSAMEMYVS